MDSFHYEELKVVVDCIGRNRSELIDSFNPDGPRVCLADLQDACGNDDLIKYISDTCFDEDGLCSLGALEDLLICMEDSY